MINSDYSMIQQRLNGSESVCYNGGFTEIGDPDFVRTRKDDPEWYCNGFSPISQGKRNCRNCTHMKEKK